MQLEFALLAFATAAIGAIGGLGGAVLLVPMLVVLGLVSPAEAAPLGLVSVAAGSLSAGPTQLDVGLVHHRLAISLESVGSTATVLAALASTSVSGTVLRWVLAGAALAGAVSSFGRKGVRNLPHPGFDNELPGEWPGTLGGVYEGPHGRVPYLARRVPLGIGLMSVGGAIAGLTGASGGFLKTPVMSEIMHVPVKVASATTTFMSGIAAAAGLIVYARQGRLEVTDLSAVMVGALVGGRAGAAVQQSLNPVVIRRLLGVILVIVAVLVLLG